MILGIGSDLIDIRRIEAILAQFGKRFEKRVFTDIELAMANERDKLGPRIKAATLAKRFAAKEACAKALGTGIRDIRWKEMGVANLTSGQPVLRLTGRAAQRLRDLVPKGFSAQIDLTMSDEYPIGLALVVLSANPM